MSEIQKADPKARRQALLLAIIGTIVGAALILGFDSNRSVLQEWILSEPSKLADRIIVVLLAPACVLSALLLCLGAYCWVLGARVSGAQQYPPPAQAVIRDTRVVRGRPAVHRGNMLKALAVCIIAAAFLLPIAFWRLAVMFSERVA